MFTRTITCPNRVQIRRLLRHLWWPQIFASSKFSNFSDFAPKKVPRGILVWLPPCALTRPIQRNKPFVNRLSATSVMAGQSLPARYSHNSSSPYGDCQKKVIIRPNTVKIGVFYLRAPVAFNQDSIDNELHYYASPPTNDVHLLLLSCL